MPLRIVTGADRARDTLLKRATAADISLPEPVRVGLRAVFGRDLNAEEATEKIVAAVRNEGDNALRRFSSAFDAWSGEDFAVSEAEIDDAYRTVPTRTVDALRLAADRIRSYHEKHVPRSWLEFHSDGSYGQIVRPLARVGLYAPGGRAVYPSTVLMLALPARAAGVPDVVLATPPGRDGRPNPVVLVAARESGVSTVYRVGGAQAIAALAYGTATIARVDKICGPGNIFVALAKRLVFGAVAIDQVAGPTETLIVADDSASPKSIALDLFAQAEHDPLATAILITRSASLAQAVSDHCDAEIGKMSRAEIIADSLARNGGAVITNSLDEAITLANEFAPEHLCLMVTEPHRWLPFIRNAGGIFLGERSIEAIGDYTAGPSHVFPTGGSARFSSPTTSLDFVKITTVFDVGPEDLRALGPATIALAEAEGLTAHAAAVRHRLEETRSEPK